LLSKQTFTGVVEAVVESKSCKSITIWQPGDKYSWLATHPKFGGPNAQGTPWDDDLNPKPAYYAMLDVLKQAAR